MTENTVSPDWVSKPGDTIEDLLDERGWTQAELALRAGFTTKHVNDLVKGKKPLSADAAERLASVFGGTVEFWLVREAHYQAAISLRRRQRLAARDSGWLELLPISFMSQRGWIEESPDGPAQVLACLQFFAVASVAAWEEVYARPLAALCGPASPATEIGALAAWLRQAEIEAGGLETQPFDKTALRQTLRELCALGNVRDRGRLLASLVERSAASGVAVAFVPVPAGCRATGATRWLSPDKALLLLPSDLGSNDHLLRAFFHQAGHLQLHGKKRLFLEGPFCLAPEQEREADQFASDALATSRSPRVSAQGKDCPEQTKASRERQLSLAATG